MAASKDTPAGAHSEPSAAGASSAAGAISGSPRDALQAAFNTAEAAFRATTSGNKEVMVAFGLGWQMAEVYRPDRRAGSHAAAEDDDLPGVSRLSAAELQEMGLLQIQAGITKLKSSICAAGLYVPDGKDFAELVAGIADARDRRLAIRVFHVELLETLTAADYRLGKAYGLGRALADTTRLPPDWRAELDIHRVGTVAGWIRELASVLPPHAAHPVANSLEAWARWVHGHGGDGGKTARKLPAQGRLWRSLLSGEKRPVDVLETTDYLHAGEGMVKRTGALAGKFLRHYWWLVLTVLVLLAVGVWLIVGPGSGLAAALGSATIFTSLGLSWKGIGSSLGKAGARVEEPLWEAELDRVIYERITPEEILQSLPHRKPDPDEPSLTAETAYAPEPPDPTNPPAAPDPPDPGSDT